MMKKFHIELMEGHKLKVQNMLKELLSILISQTQEVNLQQLSTGEMKHLELDKTIIQLILQSLVRQLSKDFSKDQQV